MKAYVLIHVRLGSIPEVIRNLKRINGVVDADMTFGPYDVVAVIQAKDINEIGSRIAKDIHPIPGIIDTITCLCAETGN